MVHTISFIGCQYYNCLLCIMDEKSTDKCNTKYNR